MKGISIFIGALAAASAFSQAIDPQFSGNYSFVDLGSVPGVPANYGGLSLLPGNSNAMIIGGAANGASGQLFQIALTRDAQSHISGFSGNSAFYADAPYNDGGVTFGPGGVLFAARWPVNELGQYKPGSTTPDVVTPLSIFGVPGSLSAVNFVPSGMPGAGRMKFVTYSGGSFFDVTYAPDGNGTYNITGVTQTATLQGAPEGFVYVRAGSPQFPTNSMLVAEYGAGIIAAYEVDNLGNPIVATRRVFMSGLSGAEGAHIDRVTGDFMFSTFGGGNRVIVVRGFAATIFPTYTLGPGLVQSGTGNNAYFSDDQYWVLRPGPVASSSQSPITIIMDGVAPGATPSVLQIVVESRANATVIRQTLEAFNYTTNSWTQVSQGILPTTDTSVTYTLTNPAQYVGAGNAVRARLLYRAVAPVASYPWLLSLDEATWKYIQ